MWECCFDGSCFASLLFLNILFYLFHFTCMGVFPANLCTTCMPSTHRGQKRAWELKSQKAVSCHVDAVNQTWAF